MKNAEKEKIFIKIVLNNGKRPSIFQKNAKICRILINFLLKRRKIYVIIDLPNIVNKQTCLQSNKLIKGQDNNEHKRECVKKMSGQTMTIEIKNECVETEEFQKYVDFESAALYLVSKFFRTKLKNSVGDHVLMHCTVHKIEKLLAIVELIYLRQDEFNGLFAEDINIKNCGVGYDVLEWAPDIINMRKFENMLETGEDNKSIAGRCIVDNSLEILSTFNHENDELNYNVTSIIDNVFIKFANYKANFLGANIDKFKDLISRENLKSIDKQKVAGFFNVQHDGFVDNDVYNFIANYKF